MGNTFKFKQFEVNQEGCAMKVNTDGVLLGARASHPRPLHILDIGAGTGVIALMLAQRYPEAFIEAVEIDESASERARLNFQCSVFKDRLHLHHQAIEQFESDRRYDLVVSNPPFFVNDLRNPEEKKGLARHTHELFFDQLLEKVATLLREEGMFWVILPVKQGERLVQKALRYSLYLSHQVGIHSDSGKPVIRSILAFQRVPPLVPTQEVFHIYAGEKVHSETYKRWLKDFFLAY